MKKCKHFLNRVISIFLIITFLQSTFLPTISFALTSLHQPEFTGYEQAETTDMVNLSSGDFTYNITALHIPSPEGGFTIPLSYHAGIKLEQDASWVGLGWSLNAGTISRNASQFPDDFTGDQTLLTHVEAAGGHGYSISFFGLYTATYDSNRGYGGSVGFLDVVKVGWGTQAGLTLVGVTFDGAGVHADPVAITMSLMTIASIGVSAVGTTTIMQAVASEALANLAIGTLANIISYSVSPKSTTLNLNQWTFNVHKGFFKTSYEYYMNISKTEAMFGSLYLQNYWDHYVSGEYPPVGPKLSNDGSTYASYGAYRMDPNNSIWVASDMHYYVNNPDRIGGTKQPTSIAYDQYSVMGSGISGNIKPCRLDIGDLPFPRWGENYGDAEDAQQVYNGQLRFSKFLNNKVNFRYENEIANHYTYHNFISTWGIDPHTIDGSDVLKFNRTANDIFSDGDKIETRADGQGLNDDHLVGGRYINWYTNEDLDEAKPDFMDNSGRNRSELPEKGIGGFVVVREDGMSYHYSLPVYSNKQFQQSMKPHEGSLIDPTDFTYTQNFNKFAIDWLLTAITGPDFVDRNENGKVDDGDWGYWVLFDYGRFSANYKWRAPYCHYVDHGNQDYAYPSDDNNAGMFAEGIKEMYYLNTIHTRTHTALFIKSQRKDGKSHFMRYASDTGLDYNDFDASASLKLDKIILLKNEDYDKLKNDFGYSESFSDNEDIYVKNTDTFSNVIDVQDFDTDMNDFIAENQLRKVDFIYDYSLCPLTENSFEYGVDLEDKFGKLTLNEVAFYGKSNKKLMPNYVFGYNNDNPNYEVDKWDAWGFYKSNGEHWNNSHFGTDEGKEWSLSDITTPLGSTMHIEYERDQFDNIGGAPLYLPATYDHNNGRLSVLWKYYFKDLDVNDILNLEVNYNFLSSQQPTKYLSIPILSFEGNNNHEINLEPSDLDDLTGLYQITSIIIKPANGYSLYSYGGDLRVKQITTKDEGISNNEYKIKYVYTDNGSETGNTSGVISLEPEYVKVKEDTRFTEYYNLYDYPSTPVLYSKVNVYSYSSQTSSSPSDYSSRMEYNFVTPSLGMVTKQVTDHYDNQITPTAGSGLVHYRVMESQFDIAVKTSKIGSLISNAKFNNKNLKLSETKIKYFDPNTDIYGYSNLGRFVEGSFLFNVDFEADITSFYIKLFRTNKTYYPQIIESVTNTEGSVSRTITNTAYDHLTGNVLETEYYNSFNQQYKTVSIPAYKLEPYAQMGSKADDIENKNMMTAIAENKVYSRNSSDNNWYLISGDVQTWKNDWSNYRVFDNGEFVDGDGPQVWRKSANYVWKSLVQPDGTVALTGPEKFEQSSDDFNFSNPSSGNNHWIKTNETVRYDNYSHALEVIDMNNNYSAKKMGYNNSMVLANASNTRYSEFTYTGAEDIAPESNGYFGGEVKKGFAQRIDNYAHTGKYCIQLEGSKKGFLVDGTAGNFFTNTFDFNTNRKYRTSVWLKNTTPDGGRLFCEFYNGSTWLATKQVKFDSNNSVFIDGWYLLSLDIDFSDYPTANNISIGVKNNTDGTYCYFDDFRVHPLDAPINSYVYDEKTGDLVAVLDKENFATKFTYDASGRLLKTWKETKNGFRKISENVYHYSRPLN